MCPAYHSQRESVEHQRAVQREAAATPPAPLALAPRGWACELDRSLPLPARLVALPRPLPLLPPPRRGGTALRACMRRQMLLVAGSRAAGGGGPGRARPLRAHLVAAQPYSLHVRW